VDFKLGHARNATALLVGCGINKIVSSLVFHQVPMAEKQVGLAAMRAELVPNGELHLADYGLQRPALMRKLFRIVQIGDGYENTEPNWSYPVSVDGEGLGFCSPVFPS